MEGFEALCMMNVMQFKAAIVSGLRVVLSCPCQIHDIDPADRDGQKSWRAIFTLSESFALDRMGETQSRLQCPFLRNLTTCRETLEL
jgi:hypothetical protein